MPITQTSWLTNLTEDDLTEQLSQNLTSMQNAIRDNNQNIDDIIGNYITSVKNDISVINDKITSLQGNDVSSLIGGATDGYGTTTSGSVMGKLNYLIYLLAPTPATFNYTSAGTFNNITIPTGVKFVSITACGGSGGGGMGGSYIANNLNTLLYSGDSLASLTSNISSPLTNINSMGRRFNMTAATWSNGISNVGTCTGTSYNYYKSTATMQIAKNITMNSGAAGTTAAVVSQTKNVATSEVITVTVGAGGGNMAAGTASTIITSNGTVTASGGAAGTRGSNTPTAYSNWTTFYSGTAYLRGSLDNGLSAHRGATPSYSLTNGSTVITVTGTASRSASANTLGRAGGKSGAGAAITFIRNNNNIALSNGAKTTSLQYKLGSAGSTGGTGYVRVSW